MDISLSALYQAEKIYDCSFQVFTYRGSMYIAYVELGCMVTKLNLSKLGLHISVKLGSMHPHWMFLTIRMRHRGGNFWIGNAK
jgi:hypothetical protein